MLTNGVPYHHPFASMCIRLISGYKPSMTGGIIQLVAYGVEDIFLTKDPQITFFKVVYRRHTNFSNEFIPQTFSHKPDFGKTISCTISRAGDLVYRMYLVITLPKIPKFHKRNGSVDTLTVFSWVRRIGFALIKSVEIEIGGQIIDKQYGDWMNIWYELTMVKDAGIKRMIGDVDKMYSMTSEKDQFILYIPLQFWFCRSSGLALPILALQYHEVKLNITFNDADYCYNISPTHFIKTDSNLSNLIPFEYIQQTINGITSYAQFIKFDNEEQKMYFNRISEQKFQSISHIGTLNDATIKTLVRDENNQKYIIKGMTSGHQLMPSINSVEISSRSPIIRNLSLRTAFLLVEYIFLDDDERARYGKENHEYLIEQVQYNGEKLIDSNFQSSRLGFKHPCKEIFFVLQKQINKIRNDHFNYTDGFRWEGDKLIGNNMIKSATIMMNGHARMAERNGEYYNNYHPYLFHTAGPTESVNVYSMSLSPEKFQPTGSGNMSKIDNLSLDFLTTSDTGFSDPALLRVYATNYNIFRISSGLSGMVFVDQ